MTLDKTLQIFRWHLTMAIPFIVLLFINILNDHRKEVESMREVGGINGSEGIAFIGIFLIFFVCYLLIFIALIWYNHYDKTPTKRILKIVQVSIFSIFAVLPSLIVVSFLLYISPNPFKQYQKRTPVYIDYTIQDSTKAEQRTD